MITIVMPYYNNPGMLKHHISVWEKYKKKNDFRVIVVDDGSTKEAVDVFNEYGMPLQTQLYKILVDIPWNWIGAKNLGMTHASGWCVMTDIDHVLDWDQAERILQMKLDKSVAYVPRRRFPNGKENPKRHANSFLIHRDLFWEIGGYDEAFSGWYGTDSAFTRSLNGANKKTDEFALTLYGRSDIPDASTTEYSRKDGPYHVSKNKKLNDRKYNGTEKIKPLNFPWERVI